MSGMPRIDLSSRGLALSGRGLELARACVSRTGHLRATKPKGDGEAMYVWRMLVFYLSPHSRHHCMPVTAEFDMPNRYWAEAGQDGTSERVQKCAEMRRARMKELDRIVDVVTGTVPIAQWHGVSRWKRTLFG